MIKIQHIKYDIRILYLLGVFVSLLFSFAALKNVVINPDGLCYVLSAEKMRTSGLKEAMQFCTQANWPFYSFLLIFFSTFLPLSLETIAYLLNAIFDAGTLITFVMILRLLTKNPQIILLGMITIICAHDFNSVRDNIIRDHGFWMFYLVSIYFFLRYASEDRAILAFNWMLSLLAASLFRVEGLVFLILLPFSVLFLNHKIKRFVIVISPLILLFLLFSIFYFLHGDLFGRIQVSIDKIQHSLALIASQFLTIKTTLAKFALNTDAMRDLTLVTVTLLIVWYLITAISQLSWIYAGLLLFAAKIKINIKKEYIIILASYFIANLIITTSFFGIHLFLSKRYLMGQNFILMLFVPFVLNYLLEKKTPYRAIMLSFVFVWLFLSTFHVIFLKKTPHYYLREAGNWILNFAPTQSLYTNNEIVLYYANLNKDDFFKTSAFNTTIDEKLNMNTFEYAAIDTKKSNSLKLIELMKQHKAVLIRQFSNKKNQQILLYKMPTQENHVL